MGYRSYQAGRFGRTLGSDKTALALLGKRLAKEAIMHWDVVEVQPAGNRTLKVRFSDGLTGTIRLDPSYCNGVFGPLLDDKLLEQATVQYGVVAKWFGFGAPD